MSARVRGPWYVTQTALEDYLDIMGHPAPGRASEAQLRAAEEALIEMALDAVDSERIPQELDSGALRYKGPAPHRLSLVVTPQPRAEGSLPQLVRVTCDPRAKRRIREDAARAAGQEPVRRGPGRPEGTRKVSEPGAPWGGVEVKLRLPADQTEWLRAQPGGAQAWLRRQVEVAMRGGVVR